MNTCESHEMLLSTWLDGELDRPGQVELFDHVVRCESCREYYLDARGLDGLIAAVRPPAEVERPSLAVWQRIRRAAAQPERSAARRRLPAWALQVAAVLVVAIGLGVLMWQAPGNVAPQPTDVEVRLGEDSGQMTEQRFIELTKEVLRADPRFHLALYQVMDQVMRDTATEEASFEDRPPRFEPEEGGEIEATRNPA